MLSQGSLFFYERCSFNNCMQKIIIIIQLALLFGTNKLYGQEVESLAFNEIRIGYAWSNITQYGFQFEFEKKHSSFKKLSFLFEYHYSRLYGGYTINNPGSTKTNSFPVLMDFGFINIKWHPIITYKQPFSLFFITGGVGYFRQRYPGVLGFHGPGVKLGLGLQYAIKKKFTLSAKYQIINFFSMNDTFKKQAKVDTVPITLSFGYRFLK